MQQELLALRLHLHLAHAAISAGMHGAQPRPSMPRAGGQADPGFDVGAGEDGAPAVAPSFFARAFRDTRSPRERVGTPVFIDALRMVSLMNALVLIVLLAVLHTVMREHVRPVWDESFLVSIERGCPTRVAENAPLMHQALVPLLDSQWAPACRNCSAAPLLARVGARWVRQSHRATCLWRSLSGRWAELQDAEVLRIRIVDADDDNDDYGYDEASLLTAELSDAFMPQPDSDQQDVMLSQILWRSWNGIDPVPPAVISDPNNTRHRAAMPTPTLEEPVVDSVLVSYAFALHGDILLLGHVARKRLQVSVITVDINAHDPCLGTIPMRVAQGVVLGYDATIIGELLNIWGPRGYLHNFVSDELFDLSRNSAFANAELDLAISRHFRGGLAPSNVKLVPGSRRASYLKHETLMSGIYFRLSHRAPVLIWALASSMFIVVVIVSLISIVVREVQNRALLFGIHLSQIIVRLRAMNWRALTARDRALLQQMQVTSFALTSIIRYAVLVICSVAISILICDIVDDDILGPLIFALAWVCDLYLLLAGRTLATLFWFPKIIWAILVLLLFYISVFPFGFPFLAFALAAALCDHTMLFFYSCYEAPAVALGRISYAEPRENMRRGNVSIMRRRVVVPHTHAHQPG